MLLEILSGNTDPTRLNVKPGEQAPFLCGTVPDILGRLDVNDSDLCAF